MKDFAGKVAVITGGASGIGYALAREALARDMRVVLADIEDAALDRAATELDAGDHLLTVKTDVSSSAAVESLAATVDTHFGATHLLFNNAGVGGNGPLWEQTDENWDWTLGVNLRGVANGVRAFAPRMIAQNAGHIVNTASIAGLISAHGSGTYAVSKFAVVALSEVLLGDLQAIDADVGVSVLCPSFVNTRLYDFERNRPGGPAALSEQAAAEQEAAAAFFAEMMSPDVVAKMVFDAIESDTFYVLTHPEGTREMLDARLTAIKNQQAPKVISMMDWPLS